MTKQQIEQFIITGQNENMISREPHVAYRIRELLSELSKEEVVSQNETEGVE